ncbi:MAG: hypothetical protein P4L73_19160 [Caulobacteraceae bacterium]|nr:hypothetical protein [Caulobacteraceae bacterium]
MTSRTRPDLLDRRQRLAAALLLSAIDLPQEMAAVARLWREAARVCPGVNVGEMRLGDCRGALVAARDLIDQLLAQAA